MSFAKYTLVTLFFFVTALVMGNYALVSADWFLTLCFLHAHKSFCFTAPLSPKTAEKVNADITARNLMCLLLPLLLVRAGNWSQWDRVIQRRQKSKLRFDRSSICPANKQTTITQRLIHYWECNVRKCKDKAWTQRFKRSFFFFLLTFGYTVNFWREGHHEPYCCLCDILGLQYFFGVF